MRRKRNSPPAYDDGNGDKDDGELVAVRCNPHCIPANGGDDDNDEQDVIVALCLPSPFP